MAMNRSAALARGVARARAHAGPVPCGVRAIGDRLFPERAALAKEGLVRHARVTWSRTRVGSAAPASKLLEPLRAWAARKQRRAHRCANDPRRHRAVLPRSLARTRRLHHHRARHLAHDEAHLLCWPIRWPQTSSISSSFTRPAYSPTHCCSSSSSDSRSTAGGTGGAASAKKVKSASLL